TIGKGDMSYLEKFDIQSEPFILQESGESGTSAIVLLGTALNPDYDFTPMRFRKTRRVIGYAKISFAFSLVMAMVSLVFFALGWSNASTARVYEMRTNAALYKSAKELKVLEDDYAALSKNLDLSHINSIIDKYKDFQAEPKLQQIVDTISQKVPADVFITKIDVSRETAPEVPPNARVMPSTAEAPRTSRANAFNLVIQGIINSPYPQSKEVFSTFIASLQEKFKVSKAAYVHKDQTAEFSLNCEMKI
ncbi:MAG TPA: hypothetical protein VMU10_08035, partial [Desulfomonilia bacterium]|nr:hypothetical protein [Desulfomonilia bacterium]